MMDQQPIGRGNQLSNSFVRLELKQLDIQKLDWGTFQRICRSIDSQWRDVAALADNTRYKLSAFEVEECAKGLLCNLQASPAQQLLKKFSSKNMTVGELAVLLDKLHIEDALTQLCNVVPLVIIEHPAPTVIVSEGGKLILTCKATGFPYPQFCWFKEQQQLTFSNNSTLELNDVRLSAAGRYICRIHHTNHVTQQTDCQFTSYCDVIVEPRSFTLKSLASSQLTCTGGCAPTITEHPVSETVRTGDSLLLTCQAFGQPMPQYFWVKDGAFVGTSQHFTVANADTDSAGEYYCIAKNTVGETKSKVAQVSVLPEMYSQAGGKPSVLKQPVDQSHGVGGEAVFNVEAEYFGGKLSYQWFHESECIPGATSPELRVAVNGVYNKGRYQCHIYATDKKEVLSRPAELTVTPGPLVYTAADKLALFIGVSTYKMHGVPLPAVEHDLQESVKVFEQLHFKVISLLDLTLSEMNGAIKLFCQLLSPDVYVVFYCAGHGFVGPDGHHYLVPWDAHHDTNPNESLCIEAVEDVIQRTKPKLLMFFLDICRKRQQNIEARPTPFLRAEAVPNKIVLYAASEGQQAFEESKKCSNVPRGLFNQYLLDVIHQPMHAFELYYAVMDKFKACPYDRQKFPQFPAMLTNNEDYRRTLHDPINTKLHHGFINDRFKYLQSLHVLPPTSVITIADGFSITLKFSRVTSNVMEMLTIPTVAGHWRVAVRLLDDNLPAAVRPIRFHTQDNCTSFRFSNLQRLKDNLVVHLYFILLSDTRQLQTKPFTVDLCRPLMSLCDLDKPTVDTEPPDRKQPMEHTEDHSLQSDSGQ